MKREWKKIIESYKLKYPSSTSLDKSTFPRLLTQLMTALRMRSSQNIISGFKACGIHLLNRDAILKKFPSSSLSASGAESDANSHVSSAVIEYLQQFNYSPGGNKFSHRCSRKKISLEPGKSITPTDLSSAASTSSHTSSAFSSSNRCPVSTSSSTPVTQASQADSLNTDSDDSYVTSSEEEWEPPTYFYM